ncbi:O-antigen ligase family protein [Enhygromyxa salina]|uniref:O-Antigen ligase n=1 Tax=Enhygromyxa salina TaxID=215803 RepID=A0A2S9XLF9_9BACT|nr:O-antigen ligase family protein [Enhygromyxa salina]PRP93682.1 O-Antigen ligase [Enhygromyxa salina]
MQSKQPEARSVRGATRGAGRVGKSRRRRITGLDVVVVVLMALGSLVYIEPAPFDLLIILLLPIALVMRRLSIPKRGSVALAALALFLLANAISLVPARDLGVALRFGAITAYLAIAWVFIAGFVGKQGERGVQLVMWGWTWGAVVTTTIAIAAYFGVLPFAEQLAPQGRLHAFFKDANVLGAYLVAPAVWSASRLVLLERGNRLPWALALVVCGVGILLTYSRGAWISVAVAMFTFFSLRLVGVGSRRSRTMTLLAVPVAVVLLAVALDRLVDVNVVQDMLEQRLGPQEYDVDRFATQREALEVAVARPFGIGPGQSEQAFTRAAHNTYVRGLVENGYLGGLALAGLMFSSLFMAIWTALGSREPRLQVAMAVVAASLAAVCVESLVIDSVHWRHLWVLAALAWTPSVRDSGRA